MNKTELKNDFYTKVNKKWLVETIIPSGKQGINSFAEINIKIEKNLFNEAESWLEKPCNVPHDKVIQEFVKFYTMLRDIDKRNKLGYEPFKKYFEKIDYLKSFADVDCLYSELILSNHFLPFNFFVSKKFDSEEKTLFLSAPPLLLPEKEYYTNYATQNKLYNLFRKTTLKFLKLTMFSKEWNEDEAKKMIESALRFDAKLAELLTKNITEQDMNYGKLHNLNDLDEIAKKLQFKKKSYFKLNCIAKKLTNTEDKTIVVTCPEYIDKFKTMFKFWRSNPVTFQNFKQLMIIYELYEASKYLSEPIRLAGAKFYNKLFGIKEVLSAEEHAFLLAKSAFSMPVGVQYADVYFSQAAKKDVEDMVGLIVEIYKKRLDENSWLSHCAKSSAISKLSELKCSIGSPSEIRPYYKKFVVDISNKKTLLDYFYDFQKLKNEYEFSHDTKLSNKNYWDISPATISAYYDRFQNRIILPAGILQPPFHDVKASSSANFGGIGIIIAHEISHAFDDNGSRFDEKGNLKTCCWIEKDKKYFKKKTQEMTDLFEGKETEFGKVNGQLTASENLADGIGLACAYEAAQLYAKKHGEDFDPKAFFESYATIWRTKYNANYAKMLLKSDVHAPAKLRVNLQLSNFQPFLDTYNIKEGDKMFIAEEKRVKIW